MQILAIDWAVIGIKIAQFILSLSILIILHEFGHYITARWFGCRVEKFYLFFDPWFSLFKKKVGDTEYGIGWLPLGGYVKIAGMLDESMDKESLKQEPQKWEFRSKPAWQRLIIMLGGIIVNVLLAFILYAMILFVWGESKTPVNSIKNGLAFQDSLYYKIGFQQGDHILSVDGKPVEFLENVTLQVLMGKSAEIERNGQKINLQFPESMIGDLIESKKKFGIQIEPRLPTIVGSFDNIKDKSPAKEAGLLEGDVIKSINGNEINFYDQIKPILSTVENDTVQVAYVRNELVSTTQVILNKDKKMVLPFVMDYKKLDSMGWLHVQEIKYGFFAAIPAGCRVTIEKLQNYIQQFKLILNPKTGAYKGVGGFKAIAGVFPAQWDWHAFWSWTAFLSIILAFMNLLPIPALDGGHVMFTLYEIIFRRKPNEKFMEYAQIAGMIILLTLMVLANANDWLGWGK